jgi:hypothetical protein
VLGDELRYRSTTFRIAQGGNYTSRFVEQEDSLRSRANGAAIHLNLINRWIDLSTKLSHDLSVDTNPSLFDELFHLSTGTDTTFS